MPDKKKFLLRLSPEMYKSLEKWAADEFRSLNGQIEYLLHNSLKDGGRLLKGSKKIVDKRFNEKKSTNRKKEI